MLALGSERGFRKDRNCSPSDNEARSSPRLAPIADPAGGYRRMSGTASSHLRAPLMPRRSAGRRLEALEVLDRQLHRRIFPGHPVLRSHQLGFGLVLREQALPQAEQQPAVARALRERLPEDGLRFHWPPAL